MHPKAILLATNNPTINIGEVFNIGFGETTSINDLLDLLQNILGTSIQPNYAPKREGDVFTTYADTTLAKKVLGFSPTIPLETGLQSSIDWYKKNIQHEFKNHTQKAL